MEAVMQWLAENEWWLRGVITILVAGVAALLKFYVDANGDKYQTLRNIFGALEKVAGDHLRTIPPDAVRAAAGTAWEATLAKNKLAAALWPRDRFVEWVVNQWLDALGTEVATKSALKRAGFGMYLKK